LSALCDGLLLQNWIDDDWYVGRLKEVPGVFSQAESLEELEENIRDTYRLMVEGEISHRTMARTKEIGIVFAD
jgi:predicted RNase H-like HicB family nuclease